MRDQLSVTWGKPVAALRLHGGISSELLTIVIKFNDILNRLFELSTKLILMLFHGSKSLISSIKYLIIPAFHTTYNNEQQYKLISY